MRPKLPPYDGELASLTAHSGFLARLCRVSRDGAVAAHDLERHARRFGPEQVVETAAQHGVRVGVRKPKARRVKGPSLKTRVRALLDAGHDVETIAEVENLSPSRARRLVEELT